MSVKKCKNNVKILHNSMKNNTLNKVILPKSELIHEVKYMRLPRLELGTSTLSVLRSNQLSYNRTGEMEVRRLELLTPRMQIWCSTN